MEIILSKEQEAALEVKYGSDYLQNHAVMAADDAIREQEIQVKNENLKVIAELAVEDLEAIAAPLKEAKRLAEPIKEPLIEEPIIEG